MTVDELAEYYRLPKQIVDAYYGEFLVNTPGNAAYDEARTVWENLNSTWWEWYGGKQDEPATVGVTAFSPPAAYTVNITARGAYMLETVGSGRGYYELNFSGFIDQRLGTFRIYFFPILKTKVQIAAGVEWSIWTVRCYAHVAVNSFSGIESLIVMAENGLSVSYELSRLKAARAYLNAQSRYSTEISVTRQLAKQNAERETNQIRADFAARLQAEKNQLSRDKAAILLDLQNETRSAMRDMQQLILTAQQLKIV